MTSYQLLPLGVDLDIHVNFGGSRSNRCWVVRPAHFELNDSDGLHGNGFGLININLLNFFVVSCCQHGVNSWPMPFTEIILYAKSVVFFSKAKDFSDQTQFIDVFLIYWCISSPTAMNAHSMNNNNNNSNVFLLDAEHKNISASCSIVRTVV